jgi:HEAT repeat protein
MAVDEYWSDPPMSQMPLSSRIEFAIRILALAGSALVLASCAKDKPTGPAQPQASIPNNLDPDVRQAIEGLYSEWPAKRAAAAARLGAAGARASAALPYLQSLLRDATQLTGSVTLNDFVQTRDQVGFHAAAALAGLGEAGQSALQTSARDGDENEKRAAIHALGEARVAAAAPLLAKMLLSDESAAVRQPIPLALERIKDPQSVPALIAAFQREERWGSVWPAAGSALAALKDVRAVEPLLQHLRQTKDPTRRHLCAQILGGVHDWPGLSPAQRSQVLAALSAVAGEEGEVAFEAQKSLDKLQPSDATAPE